ncbi:MAG: flagellar biosynthesis repressor FlbT [Robiginitomaculum sp.]|nr:MAG: flagellar biosynthesis repressor FlbT [Robiginitomaculum sp.]
MSGLVLSLKANEKFLVNGALIQNGDKRGQIHLPDSSVNVLRLSDCLHPDTINTPVRHAYYIAQLILSGDADKESGALDLLSALKTLNEVFVGTNAGEHVGKAMLAAAAGRYYSVLCCLKRVFDLEASMLEMSHQISTFPVQEEPPVQRLKAVS